MRPRLFLALLMEKSNFGGLNNIKRITKNENQLQRLTLQTNRIVIIF